VDTHNEPVRSLGTIMSSIPQEYILDYQAFGLPSFNSEWSSEIREQYGLTENEYNKARNTLRECADNGEIKQINETLNNVIMKVSKHQTKLLEEQVKEVLKDNSNKLRACK